MSELTPEDVVADHRRMMQQYVGQVVPIHAAAPNGPVVGSATIVGIDWDRDAFLAEFDVPAEYPHDQLFSNVTCEAHDPDPAPRSKETL